MSLCRNAKDSNAKHNYFDGACLNCGEESPERTPNTYEFSISELQILATALNTQYLAYDNQQLHEVVNKISRS